MQQQKNKCIVFLVILLISGWSVHAQLSVTMTRDIRPGSAGSNPEQLSASKKLLFFVADNGVNGQELWKYDPATGSTMLVKDINNVGSAGSSLSHLTLVNDGLYFQANDGTNGSEPWKTDGTAAGTAMIKNINSNEKSSGAKYFASTTSCIIFSATDGIGGYEPWRIRGSQVEMIKSLNPLPGEMFGSQPQNFTTIPYGGTYFTACPRYPLEGYVFVTNCDVAIQLANGRGIIDSKLHPADLTLAGNVIFLTGYLNQSDKELFRIKQGPVDSVVLVKNIYAGDKSSSPERLTAVGKTLFFSAVYTGDSTRGLWKSDGTEAGTILVKNTPGGNNIDNLTDVNGTLFFTVSSTLNSNELWKSDGTTSGTVLVKDIRDGTKSSNPHDLVNINGKLYFVANDGSSGAEIWSSNGTATGTMLLYDINKGAGSSNPMNLTEVNSLLAFSADNGINGRELWVQNNCTTLSLAAGNYNVTQHSSNNTFFDNLSCGNLITKLSFSGKSNIGVATAHVFIEPTQPTGFVKRHYNISPAVASSGSSTITLYFTQQEFNNYNSSATKKLPTGITDAAGIANFVIAHYTGWNGKNNALPTDYSGAVKMIDPEDRNIIWNATANRWEVTFTTNSYGGFFVQAGPK